MHQAVAKERLARELGYGGDMDVLDAELHAAGLSRPEKKNISLAKRHAVADLIADRFLLVCNRGDCRAEAAGDDRAVVPASSPASCEVCGGSPVTAAIREMAEACREADIRRIVVVGGSPAIRTRLSREVAGSELEVRLVDGTLARTSGQAREDLAWGDVVVLWTGTELAHKATMAYPKGDPKIVMPSRRGLPALARAVVAFARGREDGRTGKHGGRPPEG